MRPARSFLKMKRVDPPVRGFPRHTGWVMPPASGAGRASAARSGLLRANGSVLCCRSAIHLRGSTPHRKSGVASGQRASAAPAEPIRGKHDRAPGRREGRPVLERMAGTSAPASGAAHEVSSIGVALRERPAKTAGRPQTVLYEGSDSAITSGATATRFRIGSVGTTMRRVSTATPSCSSTERPMKEWPREPAVDPGAEAGSRRQTIDASPTGRKSRRLCVAPSEGLMRLHLRVGRVAGKRHWGLTFALLASGSDPDLGRAAAAQPSMRCRCMPINGRVTDLAALPARRVA